METLDQTEEPSRRSLKVVMRIAITGIFVYLSTTGFSNFILRFAQDAMIADAINVETLYKASYLIQLLVFVLVAFLMADWVKKHVIKKHNNLKKVMYLSITFYILSETLIFLYALFIQDLFVTEGNMRYFYDFMRFNQSSALASFMPMLIGVAELIVLCLFLVREPKIITKALED